MQEPLNRRYVVQAIKDYVGNDEERQKLIECIENMGKEPIGDWYHWEYRINPSFNFGD